MRHKKQVVTKKQPKASRQDRIVIQHDYTGEVAIATRMPSGVIIWNGREEEVDEFGYLAGGWRILEAESHLKGVTAKRRRREAKVARGSVVASGVSESDLDDLSSFFKIDVDE